MNTLPSRPEKTYYAEMGVNVKWWKKDKHGRDRYRIWWHYKGIRHDIYTDQRNESLTDKLKSQAIANEIALEIDQKRHDPLKWLPVKRNKFSITNAVEFYLSARKVDTENGRLTNKQLTDITRHLKKNYLKFCLKKGWKDIRDLKGLELQQFFDEHIGSKWKYKTRKNCLTILMTFFRWAFEKAELITKVPVKPNIGEPEPHLIKWTSKNQQDKIYAHLDNEYKPIVKFLMVYGCRPSEALAVQLSSVDLAESQIYIRHSISDSKLKERTKTNRIRVLPIFDAIISVLKEATKDRIGDGYLFINPKTETHFSLCGLNRAWRRACELADVGDYTLQEATRKAVTNNALERGVDMRDIASAMGNSPDVILKHYGQISANRNLRVFAEVIKLPKK